MSSSIRFYRSNAKRFSGIRSIDELSQMLGQSAYQLQLLATSPPYRTFGIPKKDGSERIIEEPLEELKSLLKRLAFHLQTVYFFCKPVCSYGFILSHKSKVAPRSIVTNAQRHLGAQTMLNVDMRDFFHQSYRSSYEEVVLKQK